MRPTRLPWTLLVGIVLLLGAPPAGAEPPSGETYTEAELSALDRALEAANLDRESLTFRKDLAKGHACLEVVKDLLRDPLAIAPTIDALVADTRTAQATFHAPLGALITAHDRLPNDMALSTGGGHFETYVTVRSVLEARPALAQETPEKLLASLVRLASIGSRPQYLGAVREEDDAEPIGFDDERYQILRRYLPSQMAWHEVFGSPYPEATDAKLKAVLDERGEAYVHELAARLRTSTQVMQWLYAFGDPVAWLQALPSTAFPKDEPLIQETPNGRVALGTPGDDVYTGEFAVLIDPGGNDRYVGCRLGAAEGTENRRLGFFADLGGDDVYACGEVDLTLGAAVLGVAAFLDLGAGNDRYEAGHGSLGAAMGGVAVLYDDGGSDVYEGKTFTQGAAGFGIGIFQDDGVQPRPETSADEGTQDPVDVRLFDNDRLRAWSNAQAFARCRGVAICWNARGNDVYEAGGVYLHAPLFADRYQSFSQGFAIGERGIDYAGGIALIVDLEGNDRYLGDIYNQGVGYWYAAGLLYDGGGNDLYEMTQYGQGSGIHLAVGGLVDAGGHDTYVMHSGLGQGGSHDYAASILHDRGGNDHYLGMTSCNGCGLTNSVGLHIDRSGNDTYTGRRNSLNSGRPARGFGSVGVLVDLAGTDDYLGIMKDASVWRHSDLGVGIDLAPPDEPAGVDTKPAAQETPTVEVPAICAYKGDLSEKVFDELWAIAIRWEVGENRQIVPKARARLIEFGPPVLAHLDRVLDKGASGLELRAYVDILRGVGTAGAPDGVEGFLRRNLGHASTRRRRVALYLVGELQARAVEKEVVALLGVIEEGLDRRAAGVLRKLDSHTGDDVLRGWLADPRDELRVVAALGTLLGGEVDCYDLVRPLLAHPLFSVRSRLSTLLGMHHATYGEKAVADVQAGDLSVRARRTLLDALARVRDVLPRKAHSALVASLDDPQWGVRADAARVLRAQLAQEDLPVPLRTAAEAALAGRLAVEREPYVRFWLTPSEAARGR